MKPLTPTLSPRDHPESHFLSVIIAAAIGSINLLDNLARYEQIVRLQLLRLRAA
ncbi:MAG: hypothetical protein WD042_06145 [Phycisphaeraceae bacterium]